MIIVGMLETKPAPNLQQQKKPTENGCNSVGLTMEEKYNNDSDEILTHLISIYICLMYKYTIG